MKRNLAAISATVAALLCPSRRERNQGFSQPLTRSTTCVIRATPSAPVLYRGCTV